MPHQLCDKSSRSMESIGARRQGECRLLSHRRSKGWLSRVSTESRRGLSSHGTPSLRLLALISRTRPVGEPVAALTAVLVLPSKVASAASTPECIAVWTPLMRPASTNPAAHPMSAPPGKARCGMLRAGRERRRPGAAHRRRFLFPLDGGRRRLRFRRLPSPQRMRSTQEATRPA